MPSLDMQEDKVLDFTYLDEKFAQAPEIPEREPQPGDKPLSDLPELAVDKDGKLMELVPHEFVLDLLKSPPHARPLSDHTVEGLRRRTGITDEDVLEELAREGRAMQLQQDTLNGIIQQYLHKGYAYLPLDDDSEWYQRVIKQLPPLP